MNKGMGFIRTILMDWLDVTASFCVEGIEPSEIRQRLGHTISDVVQGSEAQRKTIDVLSAIWVKSDKVAPSIRDEALQIFPTLSSSEERLWLHYGMCLISYPFFRKCVAAIGQISRTDEFITRNMIKAKIAGDYGHLGGLDRSVERLLASLTDWGVLTCTEEKKKYRIQLRKYAAAKILQRWLLSCALFAHPSDGIPFDDLIHLPELFTFKLSMDIDDLRRDERFRIQRLGGGLEIVERID